MFGFVLFFLPARPLALFFIIRICVARIVSVPGGVVCSCVASGDMSRRVGGAMWRSVSRAVLPVPLLGSFDFPVSACGRDACAVFGSSCSCVICCRRGVSFPFTRYARPFVSSLVSLARLGGVSWLFFAACPSARLAYQFARRFVASSRPAGRSLILFIVPRYLVLFGSSFFVSSVRLVKQFAFSLRPAARFSSRYAVRFSSRLWRLVVLFVLFCSRLISLVASHGRGDGGGLVLSHSLRRALVPRCFSSWNPIRPDGGGGMNAPFLSARFPAVRQGRWR